jgi:hypothetical protein
MPKIVSAAFPVACCVFFFSVRHCNLFVNRENVLSKLLMLCAGGPEFCPILPEPEFFQLRQNSRSTYLCCKLMSDIGEKT